MSAARIPPEDDALLPVVRQNRFDDFIFDEPEPPTPNPLPENNEYLKTFLAWASRRRAAKREWEERREAERKWEDGHARQFKQLWTTLDAVLDEARIGTDLSLAECRALLMRLGRQHIRGELTVLAAHEFLEYQQRTVCRECLGGGCRTCDWFGRLAHADPTQRACVRGANVVT